MLNRYMSSKYKVTVQKEHDLVKNDLMIVDLICENYG